jgi:hypothetical protein
MAGRARRPAAPPRVARSRPRQRCWWMRDATGPPWASQGGLIR